LGLTIARDIVEAHGGQLELSSEPGQGSQFKVYLPLNSQQP
jgi:signal transduction histidine kinase